MIDEDLPPLDASFGERFARERRPACQLYLISPPVIDGAFTDRLARAVGAGPVAAFQLRLKGIDEHSIAALAEPLQRVCADHDVAFIVNDSIGLAKRLGADGVHLGQSDGDPRDARQILGKEAQIGVTCHDSRHLAMEAGEAGVDYVAFGAIGGITPGNAPPLVAAGADFIAVCNAVWGGDEEAAVKAFDKVLTV